MREEEARRDAFERTAKRNLKAIRPARVPEWPTVGMRTKAVSRAKLPFTRQVASARVRCGAHRDRDRDRGRDSCNSDVELQHRVCSGLKCTI